MSSASTADLVNSITSDCSALRWVQMSLFSFISTGLTRRGIICTNSSPSHESVRQIHFWGVHLVLETCEYWPDPSRSNGNSPVGSTHHFSLQEKNSACDFLLYCMNQSCCNWSWYFPAELLEKKKTCSGCGTLFLLTTLIWLGYKLFYFFQPNV